MGFLSIDGTLGEGGGSILRLAAGFSVLFNTPIHLYNIRANRTPPGLRLQHQLGLESLQQLSDGHLSSVDVGTMDLTFTPGPERKSQLDVMIRTAGSIALLSQTIQTALIHTTTGQPISVKYTGGGTFGTGAPDPYFLNNITYRLFEKMGFNCRIDIKRNGFYPKGGASASLHVSPIRDLEDLKPIWILEKGSLQEIGGIIVCSDNLQAPRVAERILQSITENLRNNPQFSHIPSENIAIKQLYQRTSNPGVGVSIWAIYEHTVIGSGTILGKRGVSSETVGKQASNQLIQETANSATIDTFTADQIIPLLVLCPYESSICVQKVSSHMHTNIELLQQFHPRKYTLKKQGDLWILHYEAAI